MKVILNLTFVVDCEIEMKSQIGVNPEGRLASTYEIADLLQGQFMEAHGGNFWFNHDFELARYINDGMDRVNACSVLVFEDADD